MLTKDEDSFYFAGVDVGQFSAVMLPHRDR